MQSLDEIYLGARELADASARAAYLAEACGEDRDLRRRVEAMLQDAAGAEDYFGDLEDSPTELRTGIEQPGTMIGRYKLLEKIGEGGMGVVYMAEQEEPVRRKVALKIIKLGMDTRQVVARFEAERQALALMDHPHIAQVLDGGATEAGRPYFVMELVQGVPITGFCETNPLTTAERLELFMPVCQAIQSAHQKGIIHRDIKPSNVLVTMHNGTPHPMVIDFGVAKATGQKLTEKTLFTNFATMIGTPAYMSPEQAEMSKLDVDTRSDIYSLGVLLYELLTGSTPFPEERLRSVAYSEMQRIITEEEPERPSTRLKKKVLAGSPTQIATRHSSLATDLDWIVMKCLEKDRNRRYDTANGLAADVQRHLSNEPVVARPPSAAYRLQKTIRRHRLAFVAGGAVAVALLGGIAASSWQAVRATRAQELAKTEATKSRHAEQLAREETVKATKAEQKATEEAENAKAIKEFLLKNLIGVDCCGDSVEPDAGSFEATQALVQKVASQMEGQFTNQPQVEAEIRQALVRGLVSARDHRGMAAQAERLVEIHTRISGPYHTNTLAAIMDLAYAKYHSGQPEEGMRLLASTIEAVRTLPPREKNPGRALEGTYGLLLNQEGRTAEALPYLREAVAAAREIDPKSIASKAWASQLAGALEDARQLPESEALWRETLESCLRDLGPTHPQTLDKQFGLGRVLVRQRRADEALSVLSPLIASFQMRFGSNNFSTLRAQCWQAMALDQKGETAAVARLYTDLHPRLMKYVPHHVGARYSFEEMADFFVRQRNYAQAKAAYEPLRTIFEAKPPANAAQFERFIQATAATQGWPAAADVCRKHFDRFSDWLWISLIKAWIFRYVGDDESYQRVVIQVLAAPPNKDDLKGPIEIAALGSIPLSAEQSRQLDAKIGALEAALPGHSTNQQAWGYRALGHLQLRLGRFDQCLAALEKAAKHQTNPESYDLFIRATCLHQLGRRDEARAAFEQAEAIMKQLLTGASGQFDAFLHPGQIYQQLLMHRETKAVLGLK